MPNWILKSTVQRLISWLPRSHRWNALFQKKISRGYFARQATFEGKLILCRQHFEHYRKFSTQPAENFLAVELGTGAWPIVPIGLYLCGAAEIWTYDLVPLVESDLLQHTLTQFADAIRQGSLRKYLPEARADRMAKIQKMADLPAKENPVKSLERLHIHVRVGDARHTTLPSHSVHFVFSTVVFEHIPAAIISGLFNEFRRILLPTGVMSHYIGLADQYANVDRTITPFNFLRYTSRQWRWLNNPIIFQTRLRIEDHRHLVRQAGFVLVHEENVLGQPEELRAIPLAPEFSHHPFEDLLVLFSWLIARPANPVEFSPSTEPTGQPG